MSLVPKLITGYAAGLTTNKKPLLLQDQAWQTLENAYVYRERVVKRKGIRFLGRLRRQISNVAQSNTTGAGTYTDTDLLDSVRATQPNAEINPGSVTFKIDPGGVNQTIYTDPSLDGVLVRQSGPYTISSGYVNYVTGSLNLTFTVVPGVLTTNATLQYFPSLPCMGITQLEQPAINAETTIWFDEIYAYVWNGTAFDEFIPGTVWASTDSDFFWAFNYRGAAPQDRLLFVTNFVSNAANPMRYTDGSTWTPFVPLVTAANSLFSCRILLSYYGRLIALNCWEGTTVGGPGAAVNIPNRCRFSQLGSPIDADAFRTDIFGRGGLIDAPTSEQIIGAMFVKNTLVVTFERTTWQLRYVGEYGLPFLWERISSDFGSESTFSSVLFENLMLSVGDKAIIASNGVGSDRIDLDIPDQVFDIENENNGVKRVFGARNYRDELIYWNYPDSNTQAAPGVKTVFPNRVLIYNYRNRTWAIFRDNVTAFGTFQLDPALTWDSTDIDWNDEDVFWDDVDTQAEFPAITGGNQQGFIFLYNWQTPDEKSLTIQSIDLTVSPIVVGSLNHNLQGDEFIQINGLQFLNSSTLVPQATNLNGVIYMVGVKDKDSFYLLKWNTTTQSSSGNFTYTPTVSVIYVGGGTITLFPKLNVKTKDFNLFQEQGLQTKLSRIDFLMEVTPSAYMTVNLFINSSYSVIGNVLVGNINVPTSPTTPFYPPDDTSDYSWYPFYATTVGQYFNINITYNNDLMNTLSTHQQKWVLLAINSWTRPGGRLIN